MAYDVVMAVIEGRTTVMQLSGSLHGGTSANAGMRFRALFAAFKPVFLNDVRFMLDYLTILSDTARVAESHASFDAATQRTFAQRFGGDPQQIIRDRRAIHLLSGIILPALDAVAGVHYRVRATRRMAATALAIRLYEIDHGKRPDALDQLVPHYLPAVPRDPYVLDAPISYRPQGAQLVRASRHSIQQGAPITPLATPGPAILYCVGNDQRDNGGRLGLDIDGELDTRRKWDEGLDHWFLLDEQPAPYDPATP